jgi:hypothetical protein
MTKFETDKEIDLQKQYASRIGRCLMRVQFSKNNKDDLFSMWNFSANSDKSRKILVNAFLPFDGVQKWIEQNKIDWKRQITT